MENQVTKNRKRMNPLWWAVIGTALVVIAVLATVLAVEWIGGSDSIGKGVPQDSLAGFIKLKNAGYSVELEQEQMLSSLTEAASEMHGITFSASMTAYLKALDPESNELKAEIFYFANETDAKLLYNAMKEDWNYTKEEGELRCKGVVVYVGYSEVLNAFEK